MGTPNDPTGRPSSAKRAGAAPPSGDPAQAAPIAANKKSGSTDSHRPTDSLSDLIPSGSSARSRSTGSEIAQFLAHPQGGAANTDDSPTVITKSGDKGPHTPPPAALPFVVGGEVPSIAGRKLGHFELIEAIGAGGMAAVLKARDLELGRVVALKILPPEAARDPESVTRFKQEARSAAKLDHENIARVYFCGEDQGLNFIAFEFVEGDNLRVAIDRRGPLPAGECVRYMIQIAAGLNHAAERGVVHRDIKPSNILITPDGRAKIVDMGLARYLGSELVNGTVTQSGVTLGTFDYISPEQALDPRRADVRSDIYSLGCTFYHALTGRPPVPEGTAARKLRAHQEDDFLDPRELNPAIPDELAAILARMVMKDPRARYQSPTDLIAHLKGLAERLNLADAVANDPAAQAVPAEFHVLPQAPKFRPWWVLAVVAVAVAAVAFVVSTADPGRAPGLPGTHDRAQETNPAKGPEPFIKDPPALPTNPKAPDTATVRTAPELVKKLEDKTTNKILLAAGTFDLSDRPPGITFQSGRLERLELIGAGAGQTRVILPAGALALKAQTVSVRGVWFDFRAPPDEMLALAMEFGAPVTWAGLRIENAERVELTECVFRPDRALLDRAPDPHTITVTRAPEGRAPVLTLTRCLFSPGVVGLALPVGAVATVSDSGFAPHSAAVQFDPPGEGAAKSKVQFERCSFMLEPGTAAVEAGSELAVTAESCVFAPVYGNTVPALDETRRGVVVRVPGDKLKGAQLVLPAGRASAFYSAYPVGTPDRSLTFNECRAAGPVVEDKGHVELRQRPWAKPDPAAEFANPADVAAKSSNPWRAFKLTLDEAVLFGSDRKPLGVTFHNQADTSLFWQHRAYPDPRSWPPVPTQSAAEMREKVWYPNAQPGELVTGVYTDLRALLKDARPDDIVLIKHSGNLPVDRVELKAARKGEGELRVTFKPHEGYSPVLVIQDDVVNDRTLFKLMTGEVTFEGLEFRLKPNSPKDGQTLAAVAVIGGKSCTFRRCVFTLAEADDSKVAAVHLPDTEKVMKMDPATRPVPKVAFNHCVIRGRGRGVWVEVSRPLELALSDTLTALDGPVLLALGGGELSGTGSSARLARVTALVGGPIVEMRGTKSTDAMRASGLMKLDVEADDCLFVGVPGAGRPLVEIEGVEPTATGWTSVLAWRVPAKANRYANFEASAVVAQIRAGGDGGVKEWSWDDWVGNVGEPPSATGNRLGKVKFAAAPAGLKELSAVKPRDLIIDSATFPDPADAKAPGGADPKALPSTDDPKPE
ncbi:MAG TPA: serine/threonine-protein kinase [Gemmata sp.]